MTTIDVCVPQQIFPQCIFDRFGNIAGKGDKAVRLFSKPIFFRFLTHSAEPHSLVRSVADLRTGGRRFDPQLGQYSFRQDSFLSHGCRLCGQWLSGKAASGFERILCAVLVKNTPGKHYRCTGHRDITEILLNTIQSINFNPYPNTPFLDHPKFKEAADNR